jgi:uncharacterized protein (DUF1919 family)
MKYIRLIKAAFTHLYWKAVDLVVPKDICIISNDCWGGEFYKNTNRAFNTPFIGLFVLAEDYINLCTNFTNLNWVVTELNESKLLGKVTYPLGLLDGKYEIHFMQYENFDLAKAKFEKRAKRITDNKFFKWDGSKDFSNEDLIKKFQASMTEFKSVVFLRESNSGQSIKDIVFCGDDYEIDAVKNFYNNLYKFSFFSFKASSLIIARFKKKFLVRLPKNHKWK